MEYIIGSLVTLATVVIVNRVLVREIKKQEAIPTIKYNQSHTYNLLKPYMLDEGYEKFSTKTQSSEYQNRAYTKIVIAENEAYWIKDNNLYTAKIVNGDVDTETSEPVDTINMNKAELSKIMMIVETLRGEGDNDNRGTGNKRF